MLPADLDRYLSEISRVLKPGGKCFITYFLLYPESLKSVEAGGIHFSQFTPKFAHPYENGCRVDNLTHLEAAIAYPESVIQELYIKHHLNIELPIRYGNWCGRKDAFDFQDVVIATKV